MMKLSEEDLVRRAIQTYIEYSHPSGHFDMDEFREDYQRFGYVIKLLGIYDKRKQLNVRLILNHCVIIYNEFGNRGTEFLIHAAYHKNPGLLPLLKALLKFFHRVPADGVITVFGEPWTFNKYREDKSLIQAIENGIRSDENIQESC